MKSYWADLRIHTVLSLCRDLGMRHVKLVELEVHRLERLVSKNKCLTQRRFLRNSSTRNLKDIGNQSIFFIIEETALSEIPNIFLGVKRRSLLV